MGIDQGRPRDTKALFPTELSFYSCSNTLYVLLLLLCKISAVSLSVNRRRRKSTSSLSVTTPTWLKYFLLSSLRAWHSTRKCWRVSWALRRSLQVASTVCWLKTALLLWRVYVPVGSRHFRLGSCTIIDAISDRRQYRVRLSHFDFIGVNIFQRTLRLYILSPCLFHWRTDGLVHHGFPFRFRQRLF